MSNDPEQIRREIERTRNDLSDNVNALGDKVNPGSIAKRQAGKVRGAAVSVKEAVLGSASDAADSGRGVVGSAGDAVSDAPNAVARKAQGSPIAAGLIAFGAGLLVSSLLPASRAEQQAAQAVKDTAQPMVNDLTESAKQVAGNLKEPRSRLSRRSSRPPPMPQTRSAKTRPQPLTTSRVTPLTPRKPYRATPDHSGEPTTRPVGASGHLRHRLSGPRHRSGCAPSGPTTAGPAPLRPGCTATRSSGMSDPAGTQEYLDSGVSQITSRARRARSASASGCGSWPLPRPSPKISTVVRRFTSPPNWSMKLASEVP